ncbi:MAG: 30S ribosomal protein S27ae [Candidatus Methanomethyliaceae archaeon]|nr:30S ribosomal protein S27ae [Candidatus Methanomethyliaceae archaeon]MDW7970394.1 30S ribosomal protein S27ae [Nitrososphaerota archaeon]
MTKKTRACDMYEYDYTTRTIKPKNKVCARCGRFMAKHLKPNPRWACGYCGYTIFIR